MTTMNRITLFMALALCAALAGTAAAQVYKWTDKDGKVHYSNQKPPEPEVETKTLKLDPGPTAAAVPTTATADAPAAAPTTGPNAKPNAEVEAQLAALDAQRCSAAKAVATRYETAPFLQKSGPDGKPVKLSVEEEAAERLKVKADVERLCKGK